MRRIVARAEQPCHRIVQVRAADDAGDGAGDAHEGVEGSLVLGEALVVPDEGTVLHDPEPHAFEGGVADDATESRSRDCLTIRAVGRDLAQRVRPGSAHAGSRREGNDEIPHPRLGERQVAAVEAQAAHPGAVGGVFPDAGGVTPDAIEYPEWRQPCLQPQHPATAIVDDERGVPAVGRAAEGEVQVSSVGRGSNGIERQPAPLILKGGERWLLGAVHPASAGLLFHDPRRGPSGGLRPSVTRDRERGGERKRQARYESTRIAAHGCEYRRSAEPRASRGPPR
jgi:hypothetical protein